MVTGHQYMSESGSSQGKAGLDVGSSGNGPEKKAGMTPADYIYRIATLVAVMFLLATVF